MKRLIISFLMILMINGTVTGYGAETDELLSDGVFSYYIMEDGTAELVSCSDKTGRALTIPESLGGYKVTKIKEGAFSECEACEEFKSANSLFRTENGILYKEKTLVSYPVGKTDAEFVLPVGITAIEKYAFVGNSSLVSAAITGVDVIPDGCFADCDKLRTVDISGVTVISDSAFAFCKGLTQISFPKSLKRIGNGAFYGCSGIEELELGDGIEEIGKMAFEKCVSVTEVCIPAKVSEVENWLFSINPDLKTVCVSRDNRDYVVKDNMLYTNTEPKRLVFCPPGSGTEELVVPEGVIIIGRNAFENHKTLKTLRLSDTVLTVEPHAFYGCIELSSIELGAGLQAVGDYAFFGCTELGDVKILSSVREIGEGAFDSCGEINLLVAQGSAAYVYAEADNVKYTVDETQQAVTPAYWAEKYINWSERNGITTGVADYKVSINREGASWLVVNFYESITGGVADIPQNPFTDTKSSAVIKAYGLGILNGMGDGTFSPSSPITRQELCVCLVKLVSAVGGSIPKDGVVPVFRDDDKIAPWAREYVDSAYKCGIITGFPDGRIVPDGYATIEEALVMLYNAAEIIG